MLLCYRTPSLAGAYLSEYTHAFLWQKNMIFRVLFDCIQPALFCFLRKPRFQFIRVHHRKLSTGNKYAYKSWSSYVNPKYRSHKNKMNTTVRYCLVFLDFCTSKSVLKMILRSGHFHRFCEKPDFVVLFLRGYIYYRWMVVGRGLSWTAEWVPAPDAAFGC